MKSTPCVLLLFLTVIAAQSAFGALQYTVQTDASGNFISGGWTGSGTPQPNAGYNSVSGTTLISGLSSGMLDLGAVNGFGPPLVQPPTITSTMSIALAGPGAATGDLATNQTWPPKVNGLNVTNLSGVTSVTVEFNWSEPLAANWGGTIPLGNGPFLVGFRTLGSGAPWNVDAEFLGLRYTTDGTSFSGGLPVGVDTVNMSNNDFTWGPGASFSGSTSTSAWKGVNLFDIDGDSTYETAVNDGSLQDAEAVYGTGMRFTFTDPEGGFLDGASFLFSTNGGQYVDTIDEARAFVIPEPSRVLLLGLGLLHGLLLRRRRP